MCELFALSSLYPATATFSLDEFSRHGGLTGPHEDGWGVAFYQGRDAFVTREPGAACQSANLQFIQNHRMTSSMVLAHIRQATLGARVLRNTQPFSRELAGRLHLFAHNGDLPGLINHTNAPLGQFRPMGETDSEYAFCFLLDLLQEIWCHPEPPSLQARLDAVVRFSRILLPFGSANFLYSDSEYLFVHGHKRTQLADGKIEPPGLFTLNRSCTSEVNPVVQPLSRNISGLELGFSYNMQRVQLVASVPLSNEEWLPLDEGEILVISQGEVVARSRSL